MEEKKPSKTGAIIGTVAAVVLCGLPGLCLLCPGGIAILAGAFDGWTLPYIDQWVGIIPLCLSVLFIAIPVVVGVLTLRTKKEKAPEAPPADVLPPSEPLPPTA
jgi:membrane protein implicated in regulation of membrane protease activity